MNRRQFLQASASSIVAASTVGQALAVQLALSTISPGSTQPRKLILDAYSRYFHWLRSPDEVAEAALELGCGGFEPTVGPYPAHVDITKVATDLNPFVKKLQSHNLRVWQLRGPNSTDADQPNVEALIGAAAQAGMKAYWLGNNQYDLTKPILPQLDALKFRVEKFVKLNEKHKMTLMYNTTSGPSTIGGSVFDLLSVLRNFDPQYVAFRWDPFHMSHHETGMWEPMMRALGPYLASISWKDGTAQKGPARNQAVGAGGGGAGVAESLSSFGETLTWVYMPIGTGLVDFPRLIKVLSDLGFNGPMELAAEYPLGGANSGADKLTISRPDLMAALKKDIATLRRYFEISKTGLSI